MDLFRGKKKIVDYKCKISNLSGFSDEIIEDLKLAFPESYNESKMMAEISKRIKTDSKSQVCILPFCHTVEAEAFGGLINLSDGKFGPRAASYVYQSIEEMLALPNIDFQQGRVNEVLKACKILHDQGEKVVLMVSGFLTIVNSLIDLTKVFKAWRNDGEKVDKIFLHISDNLYQFFVEAKKAGVSIISYADPIGSMSIIGPAHAEKMTVDFTIPLLKRGESLADEHLIFHICPKISLLLFRMGLVESKIVQFSKGISYEEACINTLGKEKIIGQNCLCNPTCTELPHGKIRAMHLIP